MKEFVALTPLIEPLLHKQFDQLPVEIQGIWDERMLYAWDSLTQEKRLRLASQKDSELSSIASKDSGAIFSYPEEPGELFLDAYPAHAYGGRLARDWGRFPTLTIKEVVALRFGISPVLLR